MSPTLRSRAMDSDQAGTDQSMSTVLDAELRTDALDVLRDALEWRLAPARWNTVAVTADVLHSALRTGDVDGFREAVYDLELAGPVRGPGDGEASTTPAPEEVYVVISNLIHTLDPRADPQE